MERIICRDGLNIFGVNRTETAILHRQIVEDNAYERHGVEVRDGDWVFDVGANIGLFAVHIARTRRNLRLFVFEPVPALHAILERNAAEHLEGHTVTLFRCGLSDHAGTARFVIDPAGSFSTTMVPEEVEASVRKDAGAARWARAVLRDAKRAGIISARVAAIGEQALAGGVTKPFALTVFVGWLGALSARRALFGTRVDCPLRTLGEVIATERVERIDLLKVDVEGAEERVLAGCSEADWRRVRQVVVEVHDVEGRVGRIEADLARRGFHTTVDREDWETLELLGIQTIYARRE